MIAYFDTSAIIRVLIGEPTSDQWTRLWNDPTRIVCARLVHPEACAALARAVRMGRISSAQTDIATADFDDLVGQIDFVEITDDLARSAGRLAQRFGLRGDDAVHLAAGITINDDEPACSSLETPTPPTQQRTAAWPSLSQSLLTRPDLPVSHICERVIEHQPADLLGSIRLDEAR